MSELFDVEIDEISLVDEPANPGAAILLFKRDSSTAVDRAKAALEGVKKALGATKPESEGDSLPATVADCDKAFKALVARFKNDPIAAMDSPAGRAIYRRRYELKSGLNRLGKTAEPAWSAKVAAGGSVKAADQFLAALVAARQVRTGEPKAAAYADLLKTPIGAAIYARRSELKKAA